MVWTCRWWALRQCCGRKLVALASTPPTPCSSYTRRVSTRRDEPRDLESIPGTASEIASDPRVIAQRLDPARLRSSARAAREPARTFPDDGHPARGTARRLPERGQGLGRPPRIGEPNCEVVHRGGQVGQVGVAVAGGQLPAQVNGFLAGGQGLGRRPATARQIARLFTDPARPGR